MVSLLGAIGAVKRVIFNPLIMLFFMGNATRYSGIIGFYMLYAKYIEAQYRQSSSTAGLYIGASSLIPMAMGIFAGGLIISVFKPRARIFFIFLFLVELCTVASIGSGLFLGCDPIKLQGHTESDGT